MNAFGSLQAKLAALGVLLLVGFALFVWGDVHGAGRVQKAWDAERQAARVADIAHEAKASLATQMVVDHYIDRVHVVLTQGATITKQVPVYVTREADARYVVPVGFVQLHDAAVRGAHLSDTPGAAADAPARVALSAVAGTVVDNYASCRANAEQLTALQDWVRRQASN